MATGPSPAPGGRRRYPADRLADLVGGAADAEPVRVAHRLSRFDVEPDQRRWQAARQERRDAADGARLAFGIVEREVAFGRSIEFEDLRNLEAVLERAPDVGPQAVAAGDPDLMLPLIGMRLCLHQVAAELADILKQRAVEALDVVPELTCGEFLPDQHRAAVNQHRSDRHDAADAVIHGQAVIHPVARAGIHHAAEPVAPHQQAVMADIGGLRQPGGARGVDVKRPILDGDGRAARRRSAARRIGARRRDRCAGVSLRRLTGRHAPRCEARRPSGSTRPRPRR